MPKPGLPQPLDDPLIHGPVQFLIHRSQPAAPAPHVKHRARLETKAVSRDVLHSPGRWPPPRCTANRPGSSPGSRRSGPGQDCQTPPAAPIPPPGRYPRPYARRPSNSNSAVRNDCAPNDSRLTPARRKSARSSASTCPGLHSTVNSSTCRKPLRDPPDQPDQLLGRQSRRAAPADIGRAELDALIPVQLPQQSRRPIARYPAPPPAPSRTRNTGTCSDRTAHGHKDPPARQSTPNPRSLGRVLAPSLTAVAIPVPRARATAEPCSCESVNKFHHHIVPRDQDETWTASRPPHCSKSAAVGKALAACITLPAAIRW